MVGEVIGGCATDDATACEEIIDQYDDDFKQRILGPTESYQL